MTGIDTPAASPTAEDKMIAFLDLMRTIGDPVAAGAVDATVGKEDTPETRQRLVEMMRELTGFDFATLDPRADPDRVERFRQMSETLNAKPTFAELSPSTSGVTPDVYPNRPVWPPRPDAGQEVFEEHVLDVLMILCCYSLPAAYAAHRGAKVLSGSRFLVTQAERRLIETTKLVFWVMTVPPQDPSLNAEREATNKARLASRKIRILHAIIRRLILSNPEQKWDSATNGVPINQEDLAATLMTFSWIILDGMQRLYHRLDPVAEQSYLYAWVEIGHELGIDARLIPNNISEAKQLTERIKARQVEPSVTNPAGIQLTGSLLDFMERSAPFFARRLPAAMMRYFLPREVADSLKVPSRRLLVPILHAFFWLGARLGKFNLIHRLNRRIFWYLQHPDQLKGHSPFDIAAAVVVSLGLTTGGPELPTGAGGAQHDLGRLDTGLRGVEWRSPKDRQ